MSNQLHLLQKHFDTALESPNGIKKLRELILTLAMQGKLVKQDPNDQPASELLKEIQAEKERLMKEGKIKKQKELPPINPEEVPYAVPEGWVWTRLGNAMLKITDGTHHSPINTETGDFLYISAKNIKDAGVQLSNATFVATEVHEEIYSRCDPEFGNILYIKDGATTGVATINNLKEPFSMLSSVALLKQPFEVYNRFLLFVLRSPYFYSEMRAGMTGVAITRVTLTKLQDAIFPLPPFLEQKRIVAKIDELMSLCDKLEAQRKARNDKRLAVHTAAINNLLTASDKNEFHTSWEFVTRHFDPLYSVKENVAELKKAILTLAMQGKLVKQDPNDQPARELLKEIQAEKERLIKEGKIKKQKELPPIKPEEMPYAVPEGWIWSIFGNIATIERGGSPRPINLFITDNDNGLNWIKIGDTEKGGKYITSTKEKIRPEGLVKTRMVYPGDFLLTNSMSFGRPYITKIEGCIHDGWLRISPPISLDKDFLYNLLSSNFISNFFSLSASGAVVQNLNSEKVREVPIPLPPLAEQKRIVAKIDELMSLCNKLENQIEQATAKQTALFDAVLAKV
ncbi:MAG: restriction endonuclease subunit S [Desulfamplus sp.]|nr:restriction endonuclease subunit S [Desulfamplus sp.]